MDIPYTLFLGLYFFGVLILMIYAAINLLHVMRLSNLSNQVVTVTFIFIAGLLFILFMSYRSLIKIDWQKRFNIGNTIQSSLEEFNPL